MPLAKFEQTGLEWFLLGLDTLGNKRETVRLQTGTLGKTLLIRQDWVSTGELSDRTDVSDKEDLFPPHV